MTEHEAYKKIESMWYGTVVGSKHVEAIKIALPMMARQMRLGKWETHEDGKYFTCTECLQSEYYTSKYCPNCGANMEGAEE